MPMVVLDRVAPVARLFGRALIAVLLLVAVAAVRPAGADEAGEAAAFLRAFSDRAIATLAAEAESPEQRDHEFRELLTAGFDIDAIARLVLGRYWRAATERQRTEFRRLFEDYIIVVYARRLGGYSGATLNVRGASTRGDRDTLVESRLLRPGRPPVRVDWRLRFTKGDWRIIDVVVEGISMGITQRAEFTSVIGAHGGDVEGLLARLRDVAADVGDDA